jgi:hypothetical protein
MNSLAIFIIAACLTSIGMLLYCQHIRERDSRMMRELRAGALYIRLYKKLCALGDYDIDQVRVEVSGVTVTSVSPAHTLLNYDFKHNGNGKRNTAVVRLLVQLLAEDFPILGEKSIYKLKKYRVYRANGMREYGYCYIMHRRHKDRLLAARGAVQLRIL